MSKKTHVINGVSLAFGIVGAVCAFIVRVLCGNALDMVHKLYDLDVLPPMWLFNLLFVVWYFLLGAAIGAVIKSLLGGGMCERGEIGAYRGIAFFLIAFFMGLAWFPMFFNCQSVFLAFVVSILTTVAAVACSYNWFGAGRGASAVIMAAFSIWSVYILVVNLSVLFGI